jgi:putative tricarboxylic transport membrane protein
MEMLSNLALGFETALTTTNLAYCLLGVTLGTLIGVLPGIGSLAAISMLLPVSFYLEPTTALIMLGGVWYGSEYGGSTASILLNLPGSPSSAVTALDGNAMAKQGRAGPALFSAAVTSFVGGTIGILILMLFGPAIAQLALAFGSAEYFALMVLGLLASAAIAQGSPVKGIAMVMVGLLLGLIGTDLHSGAYRFTFGVRPLVEGIGVVPLAMGLFGVAEVITAMQIGKSEMVQMKVTLRSMFPTREDVKRSILPTLRGSFVGSFFGTLPGTGQTVASFVAYALEKKVSRNPKKFGTGVIEGVAAPESANNAAVQTAFIPTLTLGIPGSATMAIMLGALLVHGIETGPTFPTEHPDIFWGLIASFWIGNVLLLILNIPLIGIWVRLLQIPRRFLYPLILCLICIGVFSVNNSVFDVLLVLVLGFLGYGMRILGFEPAPLVIAFVLGPMMEENFRRAMQLSRGDWTIFFTRPVSGTIMAVTILLLLWSLWASFAQRQPKALLSENSE